LHNLIKKIPVENCSKEAFNFTKQNDII